MRAQVRRSIVRYLALVLVLAVAAPVFSILVFQAFNGRLLAAIERATMLDAARNQIVLYVDDLKGTRAFLGDTAESDRANAAWADVFRKKLLALGDAEKSVSGRVNELGILKDESGEEFATTYGNFARALSGALDSSTPWPNTLANVDLVLRDHEEAVNRVNLLLSEEWRAVNSTIQRDKHKPLRAATLATGALVLLLLVLGLGAHTRMRKFVGEMIRITTSASKGELKVKGEMPGQDELTHIMGEVNGMIGALAVAQGELERSNQDLESFAALVSHDLQAPLRHIRAYTDLLLRENPQASSESATVIKQSVTRLSGLIEDLLNFSRVGQGELRMEPFALSEVIQPVWGELHPPADFSLEITQDARVVGHRGLLQTVFQNLLQNSLKYAKPGAPSSIRVSTAETEHFWRVTVQDNGLGIPSDQRERVFQLFRRLPRDEGKEGSGIGLALCKKVIRLHGGEITIVPGSTAGTTVEFTLKKSA